MKIATLSHSHIHIRQQMFFKELAKLGHEVLMIAPGQWGSQRTQNYTEDNFRLVTCRHIGGDSIYDFKFLGARTVVEDFNPDWLYLQCEPGSQVVYDCLLWAKCRKAIFTWENIKVRGADSLKQFDMVICGNAEAQKLVEPLNKKTAISLQVGVNTDHFAARPGLKRDVRVGYVGRPVKEKGIPLLTLAWPLAQVSPWLEFRQLPWVYSNVEVIVAYSQDTPYWKEQAPPYVALEALSCGCKVVVSDTAASTFWLAEAPAVVAVPQGKMTELRNGILKALDLKENGRDWVIENFSSPVIAKDLEGILSNA